MEMKNIINYALKHGEINRDMLVAMVSQMDEDMAIRFTEAVLGLTTETTVPSSATVYGHDNCRFIGYNYLKDLVEYKYDEEVTRYFKTKEDADEFNENETYRWSGVRCATDEYKFEGKRVFTEKSTCPLPVWLEGAK